jgi:outer membrane protein TolC
MQQRNFGEDGLKAESNTNGASVINSANLTWTLFDGLSMFATREKQKELLTQGELNFRSVVENLVMKISTQYYLIISLQNQVKLLTELVGISEIRYNQSLTKYRIGSSSGLEYKQAKIYLNSDSSRLLLQSENVKNAYIELFRMMNIPLDSKVKINDTIIPEPLLNVEKLIKSGSENNTELLAAKSGERVANLDIKLAKSAIYPTLDFTTGYNYNLNQNQYFPVKYNEANGYNWGFNLTIPVFEGNEVNRKIRNAKISKDNAMLGFEQARQNLESQLYQLYNIYTNNLRLIEFEKQNKEAANMNLEAAMEKYRLGALSGIEFRDIQLSYLDASDRMLNAIYQAKVSEITLHLLVGDLFRTK